MTTWKEKCGVDADGVMVDMYELEHTDEEIEAIVEILYEYFLQGEVKGVKEIELDGGRNRGLHRRLYRGFDRA